MTGTTFTREFTADTYERALASWTWLDLAGKTPVCTSLFGDVFLEDEQGCWLLDIVAGDLTLLWEGRDSMVAALATSDGRQRYLLSDLVAAARERGLSLEGDQVYDFRHPPVLGGELEPDNLAVMDFAVALNVAGQIHDQVRDLPPGAAVGEIKLEEP